MKEKIRQQEWIIIIGLLGFVYVGICVSCFRYSASPIEIANFIAVSLTLFVLVRYTFDTNIIANANQIAQLTPSVSHGFAVKENESSIDDYDYLETDILLTMVNNSLYDVKVRVFLDVKIGDKILQYNDENVAKAYHGDCYWFIGSKSSFRGHFTFGASMLRDNSIDPQVLNPEDEHPEGKIQFILRYCSYHDFTNNEYKSLEFRYDFCIILRYSPNNDDFWEARLIPAVYEADELVADSYDNRNSTGSIRRKTHS